jgi:7-carboxy-7-deazaguanine synthase
MRVTERFLSIQGEGRHMGLPSAFVRTTGCHLRCAWCDATYTFTGGRTETLDDIVAWVQSQPTQHVCLTGGEPLLQKDTWTLVRRLLDDGYRIVLETAGNLDFTGADDHPRRADLCVSMDIKCPSSGESAKNTPERLHDLRPSDQLKFVIADAADYDFAVATLRGQGFPVCPVYFNPVGGVDPAFLSNRLLAETEPLAVHVGVQLHKLVWGDTPGH